MAAKAIAKPQLRGLLESSIKKNLIVSNVLTNASGVGWKYGVCEPRKTKYADFYKNCDAEKEFQRMKVAGVFQSC